MRVLLRLLAPLLGLVLAATGLLLLIEVLAAWIRPPAGAGLVVPWPQWRRAVEALSWADVPVPQVGTAVAGLGLLLVLVGLLARRADIALRTPAPAVTASTSPRVLARLVGRRVRTMDEVAAAAVTASRSRVRVTAHGFADADPQLDAAVEARVGELLDALPLHHRPRVTVTVPRREDGR